MFKTRGLFAFLMLCAAALPAMGQSFRVQCPTSTVTHPDPTNTGVNNSEPPYDGPTAVPFMTISSIREGPGNSRAVTVMATAGGAFPNLVVGSALKIGVVNVTPQGFNGLFSATLTSKNETAGVTTATFTYTAPVSRLGTGTGGVLTSNANGAIKCQQISGGDGYSTMADGTQTFMFSFGPLSGLADIAAGLAGTESPNVFNTVYSGAMLQRGDPAMTDGAQSGASPGTALPETTAKFTYNGAIGLNPDVDAQAAGICGGTGQPSCIDGHVDPRQIIDVGVMNGNIPGPLAAFDEDDEFFLTLTNVGMIMRPDLFEQHTVHFHGYPNASSFYDGVPDASVAINIGSSFTYYYLAPDAGTYFWHCHITPPEHLQMGMVGQLFVRPRQNRLPIKTPLYTGLQEQQGDLRTACRRPGDGLTPAVTEAPDILCSATLPAVQTPATQGNDLVGNPQKYVYNDGDGSTAYDVEYPVQMHGFDPNFHFVGMTFNPEAFVDMTDKYFLLNGRSYPDTVGQTGGQTSYTTPPGPQATISSDGQMHYSQPLPAVINIPVGGKAALRLVNLSVAEYFTLQTLGIPMHVIGWNAKLLRDQAGNNTEYWTNSITLGGGESNDVILDASDAGCNFDGNHTGCAAKLYPAGSVFYLYEPDLYRLSNDAENFGGMMTEVHICNSVTPSGAKSAVGDTFGNVCN